MGSLAALRAAWAFGVLATVVAGVHAALLSLVGEFGEVRFDGGALVGVEDGPDLFLDDGWARGVVADGDEGVAGFCLCGRELALGDADADALAVAHGFAHVVELEIVAEVGSHLLDEGADVVAVFCSVGAAGLVEVAQGGLDLLALFVGGCEGGVVGVGE